MTTKAEMHTKIKGLLKQNDSLAGDMCEANAKVEKYRAMTDDLKDEIEWLNADVGRMVDSCIQAQEDGKAVALYLEDKIAFLNESISNLSRKECG
jgi:uncharacterized coiled-coil DUF342 family protein